MKEFIRDIETKLQAPLPGLAAHYKMSHVTRKYYREPPDDARIACVLALFYPKNEDSHIVFIERDSSNPNDRHKGQISFPGGKYEEFDLSFEKGALREAEEEIGVNSKDIKVLGALTELYIPVSNFLVYPFVGFMDYRPEFVPQIGEVQSIIEVPFEEFKKPDIIRKTNLKVSQNMTLKDVPYFNLNGRTLWGATAMMMSELLEVIES
jgi:8-oxo-dGTP pyrophosphatase MutT (NUDIX family)